MSSTPVHRIIRFAVGIVAAAALTIGLGACASAPVAEPSALSEDCEALFATEGEAEGTNVIVAADQTLSAGAVELTAAARDALTAASDSRGRVSVLAVDGSGSEPDWLGRSLPLNDPDLAVDTNRHTRLVEQTPDCVAQLAATARPTMPGSDILGAMQLGATELKGSGVFILLSDGMSNSGVLNFAAQAYDTAPASIVAALDGIGQLPKFTGVEVIISGIGAVQGVPLNQVIVDKFVAIYSAICTAADAEKCVVESAVAGKSPARAGLPADAALPLPAIEPPVLVGDLCQYTLGDVAFGGNSADLTDSALEILAAFAQHVSGSTGAILVQGHTTTDGDPASNQDLSERRALAVYNALIALNIDPVRLTWEGRGGTQPRVEDHDAAGNPIESAMAYNRRVVLEVSGSVCD